MSTRLRWSFMSGHFGDPALYIWDINAKNAILIDCGDLSRFSTRQLMKVSHIFLSHCHIDHFFGFDQFLRVHVGSEKKVHILGPPQTTDRVAGKLSGYTWNLIWDQNLEFIVTEFDTVKKEQKTTHFHAQNAFKADTPRIKMWNSNDPVVDSPEFKVSLVEIDHRTPSFAYAIEEKISFTLNQDKLMECGFSRGPWINTLKQAYLHGETNTAIEIEMLDQSRRIYSAAELAHWLLLKRPEYKIAYVTDGAAHQKNHDVLATLIKNASILFAETCFSEKDRPQADETKHFTAQFIAKLATETHVKKLVPIHFSKRYLNRSTEIFEELIIDFKGEIVRF